MMISVVIPLYNKEKSIRSTLESVRAQSYTDWECIVVDDGSTDKSREFAEQFMVEDLKFKVLSQSNAGVSAARNRGLKEAKGEFVAFLDGDDIWDKDFLKTMVGLIEDYPGKSIYGLGCVQIRNGEIPALQGSYYRGVSQWNYITMAFTGSSSCVNKHDAISVGLFDTRVTHGEDIDMWWRLMLLHGGASDMRPYAYYRQDAENRAMHRVAPLAKHLLYYIEKYNEARAADAEFRRFFDEQMIYRLYPYLFSKKYKSEARRISRMFDYSQLKWSMHCRMVCPDIYRIYERMKDLKS